MEIQYRGHYYEHRQKASIELKYRDIDILLEDIFAMISFYKLSEGVRTGCEEYPFRGKIIKRDFRIG